LIERTYGILALELCFRTWVPQQLWVPYIV